MTKKLTIPRPQDWHCHFRDDACIARTAQDVAGQFSHVLAMPNLLPPITTVQQAVDYRARIIAAASSETEFSPCMTLYLTQDTTPEDVQAAHDAECVLAFKLYPAGATTHSDAGVHSMDALSGVFETMQSLGVPLCIHGEVTDSRVDIFDREAVFIDTVLTPLLQNFPQLKVVLEHITTAYAADFIRAQAPNVTATITAHHLWINRSDLLAGGIKPHLYCLPIAKRETDREALVAAAISGDPHFFLGTDSAPHNITHKESACGCAGIYTAHAALALYLEVFERYDAMHRLADFASRFGAAFYGITPSTDTIELIKRPWQVPESLPFAGGEVVPFAAGQTLSWQINHEF